jgi:hypothetical protein
MTAAQTTNLQALRQPAAQASNAPAVHAGFFDLQSFELMQRVSKAFASSDLVPQQYRGADKIANCMIAMDMAQRIGANPLMVMQNLYIVHGTPSWSSKFLIATINACGRFSSLRYEWKGEPGGKDYGCRAWAIEKPLASAWTGSGSLGKWFKPKAGPARTAVSGKPCRIRCSSAVRPPSGSAPMRQSWAWACRLRKRSVMCSMPRRTLAAITSSPVRIAPAGHPGRKDRGQRRAAFRRRHHHR